MLQEIDNNFIGNTHLSHYNLFWKKIMMLKINDNHDSIIGMIWMIKNESNSYMYIMYLQ